MSKEASAFLRPGLLLEDLNFGLFQIFLSRPSFDSISPAGPDAAVAPALSLSFSLCLADRLRSSVVVPSSAGGRT